jgi:hypothetical protein
VQFGGQTPLNIARELAEAGVNILGTSPETIDLAEDRDRFSQIMRRLGIPQPESGMAASADEAVKIADRIGYPLVGEALLCAGRARHGDRARRPDAQAVPECGGGRGHPRAAGAHRQVPGQRHRGGSRCHIRRGGCLCAGGDGAHRAGRHPFRGLGLRHSTHQPGAQAHRNHRRIHPAHRHRAEGGGADEHSVRHS